MFRDLLQDLRQEVLRQWLQLATEGQYPHVTRYADESPSAIRDALLIDFDLIEGYLVRHYERVSLATKSLWYDPIIRQVPVEEVLAFLEGRLELYRMVLERHLWGEDLALMETRLEGLAIMYRSTVLAVGLLGVDDPVPSS